MTFETKKRTIAVSKVNGVEQGDRHEDHDADFYEGEEKEGGGEYSCYTYVRGDVI